MPTAKQLADAHRKAQAKADQLRIQRDVQILKEIGDGKRPADLARETGLTRGRIAQLTTTKEQ